MRRLIILLIFVSFLFPNSSIAGQDSLRQSPKIHIAFLWHMHQPIYYPYENIVETEQNGLYSFSLYDVHLSRTGPYTNWPKNAVQKGINEDMSHFGAQVSFSGSLVENLNNLEQSGVGFSNWKSHWNSIKNQTTSLGNPRIDMIGFGYHHPLMGLLHYKDIRKQIQQHKSTFANNFPGEYSKGMFPPETAFSSRIIPALVDEGIEWVLVDNLHFERAAANAPTGDASAVLRPNRADIRNEDPQDWLQLNGLWAPLPVSTQWAHQPHYVQYINPETGVASKILAVPASRYLGQEDGRGGFGALNYEHVMSQFEASNTDPEHPILIVLHHDGDNFGGGSESYYNNNFQNFVEWLSVNEDRFECTTIQDYLMRFPVSETDIIHIQDGSWLGADGGDPEFKKWNGDPGSYPGANGQYSPDRNSWGIITAAQNIIHTADQIDPNASGTLQGWKYFLNGQASDYWYWDGTEIWDSNPVRAANQAINNALSVAQSGTDNTPPAVYLPQREPYNPGAVEWDGLGVMPSDFTVWTYVFDLSGLQSVELKYRLSAADQVVQDNLTYAGGATVEAWQSLPMESVSIPSVTDPQPLFKAQEFSAEIVGLESVLVDYYVEAIDQQGNITKSPIQHVLVGDGSGGGSSNVSWTPEEPNLHEVITITATHANAQSKLHWGINDWQQPVSAYWPEGTIPHEGSDAVQTPPTGQNDEGNFYWNIGPLNDAAQVVDQLAFVLKITDTEWDNNNGNDYFITINNNPDPNPVSGNTEINLMVNETYNFGQSDIPYQSPSGSPFAGIQLSSLPTHGNLMYDGLPAETLVDYSELSLLSFSPESDAQGTPYAEFQFKVKDQSGLYSSASYLCSIHVLSAQPTGMNSSISLLVNQEWVFSESNFPFNSPVGNSFDGIRLVDLPEAGTLTFSGNTVSSGELISTVENLTFAPETQQTGTAYASFSYRLIDDQGLESEEAYTITIHVLNDFPPGLSWFPEQPSINDIITVVINQDEAMNQNSRLHWGVNDWMQPNEIYWPAGTSPWNDGMAVQSPWQQNEQVWTIQLGPFNQAVQAVNQLDFVLYYGDDNWNNNNGQDWKISVSDFTSVLENEASSLLKVFPNPATDEVIIALPEAETMDFDISLRNMQGQVLLKSQLRAGESIVLKRNRLPAGLYILVAKNQERIYTSKLIFK